MESGSVANAARNSIKLSLMTIISRLLGLVRDHFQAVFFGTGSIAMAWEVAYMLPNMLRNLLAEGIMSQAFIPIYSEATGKSEEEGRRAAGVVLGFLTVFLSVLVFAGILIFPFFIPLYTDTRGQEADFIVLLSQIMFPFIMTASLTAILTGIAQTHDHYIFPTLSPILLNLVFIGAYFTLSFYPFEQKTNAMILSFVVLGGGILQLVLQLIYVAYKGWLPIFRIRFRHPVILKVFGLMAPAVLGASLFHFNQLMDIAIASYFIPDSIGAIPALRYSQRLIQLPTGVIGVALSTAILPALVGSIRRGEQKKNGEELASALGFAFFLTAPAVAGFLLLGPSILNLIYYGGQWDQKSTADTWLALQYYALGVPFFSINKILTSSFYAYQDTRTPVRIMVLVVPVNLLLNLFLVQFLFQGGIALSSFLTAFLNGAILFFLLAKKVGDIPAGRLVRSFLSTIIITGFVAVLLWMVRSVMGDSLDRTGALIAQMHHESLSPRYQGMVHLGFAIPFVIGIYFFLAWIFRMEELQVITSVFRKKIKGS